MNISHNVVILVFPKVNDVDVAGPAQVFTEANNQQYSSLEKKTIKYEINVVSEQGGIIVTSSGIGMQTLSFDQIKFKLFDTIVIAGGAGATQTKASSAMLKWIHEQANKAIRIGSVCTGAFISAASGILDHRRAVTHWRHVTKLQKQFPKISVESDPIYVEDSGVWSSAGVTAGIDMCLGMVQADCGQGVAIRVAQSMVVFVKRPGGQNQFSTLLNAQSQDEEGEFEHLHYWISQNLREKLTVERLSEWMKMSSRNFSRNYTKTMGIPPAKSIEKIRIEAAKNKLEITNHSLKKIANSCGFGSDERMRKVFLRNFGITPKQYRKRFRIMS